jgi:hypothetical protein
MVFPFTLTRNNEMRQGRHDGRVGLSVSPDAVAVLDEVRGELMKQLGFAPSYAQVVLHICLEYQKAKKQEQIDTNVDVYQGDDK